MIFLSFKNNFGIFSEPFSLPKVWDFSLYAQTYKTATLGKLFLNSIEIVVTSAGISMIFLFISSYSIARLVLKGRKINNFIYYFFLAGTSIPVFAQLMTIYKMTVAVGKVIPVFGIGQLWSLLMPYISLQIPFLTLVLVGGLRSVPLALEEAAIIDGCNLFQVMFRVVLPTIKPVFITAMILNFLGIWNEYPVASILLTSQGTYTIPLATAIFKENFTADYGAMLRAATMVLIPQVAFYLIFQRYIIEGMATAGIKG
jgi:raffinose/stachyose/melibiose transport system permease protein